MTAICFSPNCIIFSTFSGYKEIIVSFEETISVDFVTLVMLIQITKHRANVSVHS